MSRFMMTLSYDGTQYSGWQVQKTGSSIQKTVQNALETALRHPLGLTGSGRTDAGVHALGQTAHFDTEVLFETPKLLCSLNALLPNSIRILSIEPVESDFHARYRATSKIYHYHLALNPIPFHRLYRWYVPPFDPTLLKALACECLGERDFTSFSNRRDPDSIRHLMRLDLVEQEGGFRLEFEADGFLYKMVRNLTGTLLLLTQKKAPLSRINEIFQAKDRRAAGPAAPARGLFLVRVIY